MSAAQEAAETLALEALAWLAASDDLLDNFMGATGASRDDLRVRAQDPDFLASILDFLMMDDNWVIAFCGAYGHPNEAPMRARMALPGGAEVNWT